jgi:hypothetical protein
MSETKQDWIYIVTPEGQVFSTSNWRGYGERELAQHLNDDGYPSVRIYINGERKKVAVYKLVAERYLPSRPSPFHEIRHLDGDKMNSDADNLAWGTRKDNADDRARHGRTSRGERHSQAIKLGIERSNPYGW